MPINYKNIQRCTLLGFLCGILSGCATAVFLLLLDGATKFRILHPQIIWFLAPAGFLIGWMYHHFGKNVAGGHHMLVDEIHDPKKLLPLHMAPFVLLGTVFTHLVGGSAGREGTAVQMGATMADQLSAPFKTNAHERRILLRVGMGASFGAAMAAPWAGVIFGLEVVRAGRIRLDGLWESLLASFVAFYATQLLHAPHTQYRNVELPVWSFKMLLLATVAGAIFGIMARLFIVLVHGVERLLLHWVSYPPLRPVVGGVVLLAFFQALGTLKYAGLGIECIQEALQGTATFIDPVWKGLLSAITVGSGFKGGEFIPLVFVGSTLGAAATAFVPTALGLLPALGFAAVFAGAANTPLACAVMAMELFGWHVAPFALLACYASFFMSGKRGLYR